MLYSVGLVIMAVATYGLILVIFPQLKSNRRDALWAASLLLSALSLELARKHHLITFTLDGLSTGFLKSLMAWLGR